MYVVIITLAFVVYVITYRQLATKKLIFSKNVFFSLVHEWGYITAYILWKKKVDLYILISPETSFSYLLYGGHYSRSHTGQQLKHQLSIWELSTAHNNFISFSGPLSSRE